MLCYAFNYLRPTSGVNKSLAPDRLGDYTLHCVSEKMLVLKTEFAACHTYCA